MKIKKQFANIPQVESKKAPKEVPSNKFVKVDTKQNKIVEEVKRYQLQKDVIFQHFEQKEKIKDMAVVNNRALSKNDEQKPTLNSTKKERGWMLGLEKGSVSHLITKEKPPQVPVNA